MVQEESDAMSKSQQRSTPPRERGALRRAVGAILRATSRVVVAAGPMSLVFLAAAAGLVEVWSTSIESGAYRFNPSRKAPGVGGSGIPDLARRELLRIAHKEDGASLLDPTLTTRLREAYEASPWVERTGPFRRSLGRRTVVIDVVVRVPAAQIQHRNRYYMVDAEGIRLPIAPIAQAADGIPLIRARLDDPPAPGEVWSGRGLADALALLKTLEGSKLAEEVPIHSLRVREGNFIDRHLRRRQIRPRLVLETCDGGEIRWGVFAEADEGGGPTNDDKIDMLARVIERYGQLREGEVVDVRTDAVSYSGAPGAR
jgi:hypothetical protein